MKNFKKNIFFTGAPSSGKTTVIKRVIKLLHFPINGFYTEAKKENGRRIGFLMKTISGEKAWLGHQDIQSEFAIRRYGVSIDNIEKLVVPAIMPVKNNIIILDEIGKMECFSLSFRKAAIIALDSPNIVLGTITLGGDEFIQAIKLREDIESTEVTITNRDTLPELILNEISRFMNHMIH